MLQYANPQIQLSLKLKISQRLKNKKLFLGPNFNTQWGALSKILKLKNIYFRNG